jgi:CubicO group peptidase (beta-lactamase class C family)/beta-glucosidase-like glycosyl hydrolase
MNGLLDNGVLACGKHFPGHGNADSDSHLTLPTIHQPKSEMDTIELYPFRKLIDSGLTAMMVAHLHVPALDSTANLPSTLSSAIINDLLQKELGFDGLIFTDALNMKGVSACYQPGILDRTALLAGNDVLLYSEDVHKAIEEIQAAVDSGLISQPEIDRRVRKILMAKYWCGLNKYAPVDTVQLYIDLNRPEAKLLQQELYEQSVTVLSNHNGRLPLKATAGLRVASVSIGKPKENTFQQALKDHYRVDLYAEEKDASSDVFSALYEFLKNYDLVIISLHGTTMRASNGFGISENAAAFIDSVLSNYKTVFVDFGNAYTLTRFTKLSQAEALVLAYEDFPLTQELAAQAIVGAEPTAARLPVTVMEDFSRGSGVDQTTVFRLKHSVPEAVGIDGDRFLPIDSIVENAIRNRAMPGCQVLVAKDGLIIFNKSYGYQTYDSLIKVTNEDIYDVASVTKIAATALATMSVFDAGDLELNAPVSKYLPKLRSGNKRAMIVREMLAHQAGLPAWIPFWKQLVDSSGQLKSMFADTPSKEFSVRICDSLYMKKEYSDSLQQWVYKSPMGDRGKYVYSDLGPMIMKWAVERISGKPFDQFLETNYYAPLQLGHTAFQPYDKFAAEHLVPTAYDSGFRKRLLKGDVHDPAAAMQGGVSGNAGLFSNAFDLAVIMQMLLNKGTYGGVRFLKPNTISLFTRQQFLQSKNRRGLLFDRPETEKGKPSPCCPSASAEAFGHQGFTGTCVWADPKYNLVYIFLSNRVHPDETNDKLIKMNVRTSIQQVVYDAVLAQ